MRSKLIFISFLSLLILLAGCSEEIDCSAQDTDYKKYGFDEEADQCVVIRDIQRDVCGNGIAEDGETYCNCKKDVTKTHPLYGCDGQLGDYLEKSCDRTECVLKQNNKVVDQTKSIELKNSDVEFKGEFTIKTPFIINSYDENKMDFSLELFKTTDNYVIKDIVVKEMRLVNSQSLLLAKVDYNTKVPNVGYELPRKQFSLSDTSKYSSRESLRVTLVVQYVKDVYSSSGEFLRSENHIEELTSSLGTWEIINPNLYEED